MSKMKWMCNMITFNSVVEELSGIEISKHGEQYLFHDQISEKFLNINAVGKEICDRVDGKKSISNIAEEIAEEYEWPIDEIKKDVLNFILDLYRRKMILVKGTLRYNLIWCYNKLIFVK